MTLLPSDFTDLEPFAVQWCLATEPERYARRLASSMPELQAFYDAFEPRAAAAIEYCDQYPLEAMPDAVVNLMHLIYSFINVSFAAEVWLQPRVPDTGSAYFTCFLEPTP
jgi:hypothetical protein